MTGIDGITFAQGSIDRTALIRDDAEALAAMRAAPQALALALWRGKPVLRDGGLGWLPLSHPLMAEATTPPVFLGLEDGAPRFAVDVSAWEDPAAEANPGFVDVSENRHTSMSDGEVFGDLRANMAVLTPSDGGNAAAAKGVLGWHATHLFCARCGAASEQSPGGWKRVCPACKAQHFPRTDPVVIMLILHGNSVLMGRSPGWPEGMYSLLAGFMEPGETIEDAVRREVLEETQVRVGPVRYMASQPWPFPSSLMIGCAGEAETTKITLDPVELDDAIWMSREDVRDSIAGTHPTVKAARKGAIARSLLEEWVMGKVR